MADADPKSSPISILYVDDNPGLLETCRLYLEEDQDFTVTTLESAMDAIDLLRTQSFDAIVADYDMPEMDGIALLKQLKKDGNTTPFIIFTGKGREEVVIEALNCGADFYIQKGGEPALLFRDLSRKVRYAVAKMRSEIALKESEERYRRISENANIGLFQIVLTPSRECVIRYMSDRMADLTGLSLEEMYTNPKVLIDKALPEYQDTIIRAFFSPAENLEFFNQALLYNGNCGERWMEIRASPSLEKNGTIVWDGVFTDIDPLKRAEEELRKSEERYRAVVETQTELICRFLPDGTHLFVNDAYCRYFSLDRESIIGNRFMPMIHPDDSDRVTKFLSSLTKNDPTGSIDQRIIMPDDKVLWQRWNTRAIFDEDGQIIEYQSVGRDTTYEKETEELLAGNAERAKRQRKAIADLALDAAILSGDMEAALGKIMKTVSETLETERVGAWVFSKKGSLLRCLSLYDAKEKRQNNGITLKTDEYPRYFDTLRRKHRLCVEDASSDSRVSELKDDYLAPMGISSMLDVGILKEGRMIGILCLEDTGAPRRWHADEEGFANIAASLIAQLFEGAERRQAEEALRESEERFRSLAEHAGDILYRIDLLPDIHFTYVNPAIEEISGYTPQEFYNDPGLATRIIHPDDRYLIGSVISAGSFGQPLPLRWIRKDRGVIWIEERNVPIYDDKSTLIAIEGIARDITAIRQAEEEALLETDTRYRSLFSSIHEGYAHLRVVTDSDGTPKDYRIVEVNQTMEMIIGLSGEEAIGNTLLEVLPEIESDWFERFHATALSGEPQVVEYHHPGLNSDYEVLVYSPKRGECALLFHDITEKKKREKETKQSLREKEILLKEIHHRVKNNMQVISSLLMLQRENIPDPRMRELFRESENRVFSIALVHEKLYRSDNLSRIHYGEYLEMIGDHILASRDISSERITLEIHAQDIYLPIDKAVPLSLITNELLTNSLKHAFPDGRKGTIRIELQSMGRDILYRFADDGIGFPAEIDFWNTTTLGMELVNNLVMQLMGTISLYRDGGTRFEILFPLKTNGEDEE
ncbi:PAS domain S-box protein [Methanocalculus taiwanensis]|uniref:PAS domain S-box protein n=1 Tax=Methanocalculus taiwanensis TaxID=106207 RepID=A0ABD4TGB5_9EURY|nr:PAS domain S-box protein [Methanocalculus taiwanensis]MCQ1537551.1 PAS domain S-box protein [Methanocalculus taiwanensis]